MNQTYIQLDFPVTGMDREILIARLSEAGCDAFEETDETLRAIVTEERYDAATVAQLAAEAGVTFTEARIAQQNWNAIWEAGFEPVTVPGFCTVRAAFHPPSGDTPHEIIITPKMSFGTGHHATTRLMMQAARDMDFRDKRVLDFGTGTGILAILAKRLGAGEVTAIDNDAWSVENAAENTAANGAGDIRILRGSLESVTGQAFDILLANINRHILLEYMAQMRGLLAAGGMLVVSGILTADRAPILESAAGAGFILKQSWQESDWLALSFTA